MILTDKEIEKARADANPQDKWWDDEDVLEAGDRAIAKAQLKKVVEWIEEREGHIICRSTDGVVTITLSVSDWQALLEETQ